MSEETCADPKCRHHIDAHILDKGKCQNYRENQGYCSCKKFKAKKSLDKKSKGERAGCGKEIDIIEDHYGEGSIVTCGEYNIRKSTGKRELRLCSECKAKNHSPQDKTDVMKSEPAPHNRGGSFGISDKTEGTFNLSDKVYGIHHKDGDSLNDSIHNLILMKDSEHKSLLNKRAGDDLSK